MDLLATKRRQQAQVKPLAALGTRESRTGSQHRWNLIGLVAMKHWRQEQVKPLEGIAQLQAAEEARRQTARLEPSDLQLLRGIALTHSKDGKNVEHQARQSSAQPAG